MHRFVNPRRVAPAALTIALFALSAPAAAQIEEEDSGNASAEAAYFAISNTPLGGLPSVLPRSLLAKPTGVSFRSHLGFTDEEGDVSRRLLSFGLDMPMGNGSLGFTAGISDYNCDFSELEEFGFDG